MSIQGLCLFFNLFLCCISSLCFWGFNSLSDRWFAGVFTHSIYCIFILLIFSFVLQKTLMSSYLFIFTFIPCTFGIISKKIIAKTNIKETFLFYSTVISNLKPLIHFEFFQHHLLKRQFFPHWVFLAPLSNIEHVVEHVCVGLILGSQFWSTGLHVFLYYYLIVLLKLCNKVWISKCDVTCFVLLP